MFTGATWLHLPTDPPRLAGWVDFEWSVLSASVIATQAPWVRAQRWWTLPESGALFLGAPRHHLRAAYLLDRHGFVTEWSQPDGRTRRLGHPATLDDLVRVLRLAFFDETGFRQLPWVTTTDEEADADLRDAWNRAYGHLLDVPAPAAGRAGTLTPEQQKTDVLRARHLQPTVRQIGHLRALLDARLREDRTRGQ